MHGKERKKTSPVSLRLDGVPRAHRFAHRAMAATFEIYAVHSDPLYAAQAAWAAFEVLDRLEQELSRYVENSDVSRIRNLAPGRSLKIGEAALECLELSGALHAETNGAFDVTVGALVDCWRTKGAKGSGPSRDEIARARQRSGMQLIDLERARCSVRTRINGLEVDLGGIGKGFAIDRMASLLREWDIVAALIRGGHSSILALGGPPGAEGWPVTLPDPADPGRSLARVLLSEGALSGSGLEKGRHIIDPRTARPVDRTRAAWAFAPDAARADALSTAFMVMAPVEVKSYCASHAGIRALIVTARGDAAARGVKVLRYGRWEED